MLLFSQNQISVLKHLSNNFFLFLEHLKQLLRVIDVLRVQRFIYLSLQSITSHVGVENLITFGLIFLTPKLSGGIRHLGLVIS